MEMIQSHGQFASLLLLLQFLILQLLSSAYTPPDKYFINCGSDTAQVDTRKFVGDSNPTSFSLSTGPDISLKLNSPAASSDLYQTVRIFTKPSSYEFDIDGSGTYMVRLHFFLSSYGQYNTSTAVFSVSLSGFSRPIKFIFQDSNNNPVLKEYILSINTEKFAMNFTPSPTQVASFASVNAIEVFPVPEDLIPDQAQYHISSVGINGSYGGLSLEVFETVHRINVGGPKITPGNDPLWRNWISDDSFLYLPYTSVNVSTAKQPSYQGRDSEYIAPDNVYMTAKEMNINPFSLANTFNITWNFSVSSDVKHLVRMHFCNNLNDSVNTRLYFTAFINKVSAQDIDLPSATNQTHLVPSYYDFVVDSVKGFMEITVGPNHHGEIAILNGLEIMEMLNTTNTYSQGKPRKKQINVLVGSVVGGIAFIGLSVLALLLVLKHRNTEPVEIMNCSPWPGGTSDGRLFEGFTNPSLFPNMNSGLKIPLAEIHFATKNFSQTLLIGSGGFGKVYKGVLRNNMTVAVKRSEPGRDQGLLEFQREIIILSNIRHRHLVSLIGFCDEQSEMILVYEFMEKGTLRSHLYSSDLPCLSWKQRLEICIGLEKVLHYLHNGAAERIVHRDVKSTNILLDENYIAKVADFGLSRPLPSLQHSHVSTAIKGTFGYLDPEYFRFQRLTDKSDVYSFGVVLLEVLCARPALNNSLPTEQANLAEWATQHHRKGLLDQTIDPSLVGKIDPNSLKKFWETAEKCLSEYGAERPTMADVLWDLEYVLQLQGTTMQREPHEDSTTCATSEVLLPAVHRVPSVSDHIPVTYDGFSETSESQVFSQLMIDDCR